MGNTILTPTQVTRKALLILHQKLNFIGTINRQYDDSYSVGGAKIGDTLKVRLPNQYTIRSGATLNAQDTAESSVSVQIANQKGVDVNFTTKELTLDLDDFADRILEPAMAVLAANVEADALTMYKDVYNLVDNDATAFTLATVLAARKNLTDNLAPMDNNRTCLLSTSHTNKLITDVKALFHDSEAIKKQYREGKIGRTAGFDFYENTLVPRHLTGTAVKATTYTVNGANQTGAYVTVATGSTTFKKGDIVTFAGCNRCHPESKADTGVLQQFVVTADNAGGAGDLYISPSIVTSGAKQNVYASPTDTGAVTKVGAAASEYLDCSMAYHRDAFTFVTADLLMPKGVHFAAREVYDGISMRIVQAYDITNDKLPCRIDVLYGYKTIRAEMATRMHADA